MKKKLLSLLMAVTMVCSLTACGGTTDDGTTKANDSGTEAKSNKLTVWCWDPAFNIAAMKAAEEVYKKDNPDFELNIVETAWEDLQQKLTTAGTSSKLDTLPDIILLQDNAFQKNVINYPDVFVDLTDSGINFTDFASAKTAYSVVEGKNYGVPFDNGTCIASYRADVLEKAGFKVSDFENITWSDFIKKGKVVLEKTGKPMLSAQASSPDLLTVIMQSAGGNFFDESGKPTIVGNDKLKEAMEIYAELVSSGVLLLVNEWDEYVGTITNNTVAGVMNGCWILATVQTLEKEAGNWEITNIPALDKSPDATNYSNQGGSSWGITTNCKNPDLAKDFMKKTFAGSVELYDKILGPTGAIATYLPAGKSSVYSEPQKFFNNQPIYEKITDYAGKVPKILTGVYFYEARDSIGTALTNIIGGAKIDDEIKAAEEQVLFYMNK